MNSILALLPLYPILLTQKNMKHNPSILDSIESRIQFFTRNLRSKTSSFSLSYFTEYHIRYRTSKVHGSPLVSNAYSQIYCLLFIKKFCASTKFEDQVRKQSASYKIYAFIQINTPLAFITCCNNQSDLSFDGVFHYLLNQNFHNRKVSTYGLYLLSLSLSYLAGPAPTPQI